MPREVVGYTFTEVNRGDSKLRSIRPKHRQALQFSVGLGEGQDCGFAGGDCLDLGERELLPADVLGAANGCLAGGLGRELGPLIPPRRVPSRIQPSFARISTGATRARSR